MIVLDTNVVSVMMHPEPAPVVADWLDSQPVASVWTTVVTLFEIRFGLVALPAGRRRSALENNFDRILRQWLAERVLDYDTESAFAAADLMARMRAQGRGIELGDLQIAGIVAAHQATLATRNTRHFQHADIELINPWQPTQ